MADGNEAFEPEFERPDEGRPAAREKNKWADYMAYHRFHEERAEMEARQPHTSRHKSLRERRREAARRRF
ncbi:MAG TPA: hypothetical protein VG778_06750 [Blastocatellia bacterium]|nr:hypothetical protein [Blastocatellia bacterium]